MQTFISGDVHAIARYKLCYVDCATLAGAPLHVDLVTFELLKSVVLDLLAGLRRQKGSFSVLAGNGLLALPAVMLLGRRW